MQDTSEIKRKIMQSIERRGPSIPITISKDIDLSILFTSAFLSELVSEKKLKTSHLRVGSSPVYFLQDQKGKLEEFSKYLKSKEKEAFILIQEKKILNDKLQDPAIRVALRFIKDFAIPFKKNDELLWRYFKNPELENTETIQKQEIQNNPEEEKVIDEKPKEIITKEKLNIFDKNQEEKPKEYEKIIKKKITKKKISQKSNEKFFNKVKEFLISKNIEILDIEAFNKNDLTLKIKHDNSEKILIAYNKKRITETDILKAYKKSQDVNLKYIIYSLGEPTKKMMNFISAIKEMDKIEKIEKSP